MWLVQGAAIYINIAAPCTTEIHTENQHFTLRVKPRVQPRFLHRLLLLCFSCNPVIPKNKKSPKHFPFSVKISIFASVPRAERSNAAKPAQLPNRYRLPNFLLFKSYLPTDYKKTIVFTEKQRQVFLKGEAYFEVAPDSLHPFIVKTEQQNLRVLGTSFAIRAYANESVVLTTLETGKVNIHSKGQEVILNPGEQSCLKGGNLTVAKVNTALFTAWHKGIFIFQDQPLENILNTLARWYNIDIFYTNENLQNIHFTGELKRYDRIQDFLCKLEILEKVRFTIKGRTVTVSTY